MERVLPYCDDLTVGIATFTVTNLSYTITKNYLSSSPNLRKLPSARREKLAIAIAQIPVRFLLLLFNFPILAQLFAPSSTWTQTQTKIGSASFMTLSATYAWEMWVSLPTLGMSNIIHHIIAFWMKFYVINTRLTSASIEETALLLRLMALSLSVMVCLGHLLVTYFLSLYYIAPLNGFEVFRMNLNLDPINLVVKTEVATVLHMVVWAINVRAIACWSCIICYMHIHRGSWGTPFWYIVICSLMCILFWMQWGYNFMFHNIEGKRLATLNSTSRSHLWIRDSFNAREMALKASTYMFCASMAFIWLETGIVTFT